MIWDCFVYFALVVIVCWMVGAVAAWRQSGKVAIMATSLGLCVFAVYIAMMWMELERPPLRTMGETRLWYSFFLPLAGLFIYARWRYRWVLSFSTLMAIVFVCINLFKPEIHEKALVPALQSPWFVPHVIVYMLAYALMGVAVILAVYQLFFVKHASEKHGEATDNMVLVGFAFLSLGMIMGAVWAKEAWGHYWTWDPKETWAAITWFAYLAYIHLVRSSPRKHRKWANVMLIVSFCLLQMCWWGINYLPSAQASSVHTYSMQ